MASSSVKSYSVYVLPKHQTGDENLVSIDNIDTENAGQLINVNIDKEDPVFNDLIDQLSTILKIPNFACQLLVDGLDSCELDIQSIDYYITTQNLFLKILKKEDIDYSKLPTRGGAQSTGIAVPILDIEGSYRITSRCMNSKCSEYQKKTLLRVIAPNRIDLITDQRLACSKCSEHKECIACEFQRCRWSWKGIKHDENVLHAPEFSMVQAGLLFNQHSGIYLNEWKHLHIIVEITPDEESSVEISGEESCSICLDPIDENSCTECVRLPCKHQFHPHCLLKWIFVSITETSILYTCPYCRTSMKDVPSREFLRKMQSRKIRLMQPHNQ